MTGLYLPGAVWRPISYRAESGLFAAGHPVGYIPHVQVGNGSLWSVFENAPAGYRKFSNAWIAKDGHSEQYAETNRIPWAQVAGNLDYLAFECEGYPSEPYTAAQINTLATWHNALGMPDLITDTPGGRGIGTHVMGGAAYGGHTCPGPGPRAGQRAAIIARAQALRTPVTPVPLGSPVRGPFPLPFNAGYGIGQHTGVGLLESYGVKEIQLLLRDIAPGIAIDGSYGPTTAKYVGYWTARFGPYPTGVVNKQVWDFMASWKGQS